MTSLLVLLTRVSLLTATKLAAVGWDVLYDVPYSRKFSRVNFRWLVTSNIFMLKFSRIAQVIEATPINRPCVCVCACAWVKLGGLIFVEWIPLQISQMNWRRQPGSCCGPFIVLTTESKLLSTVSEDHSCPAWRNPVSGTNAGVIETLPLLRLVQVLWYSTSS